MEESELTRQYEEKKVWGLSSSIDLHNCDGSIIRSKEKIEDFVIKLCDLIDMKRFGKCNVVGFGEDEEVAGYSMTQLIETSLISGHFADKTNRAFLDIFSCKYYSPKTVAEFSKDFFKAEDYTLHYTLRE